jgi:hypothetical protein
MAAVAPTAGYLWTLPLLVTGLALLAAPLHNVPLVRAASIIVLAVAGTLWLADTIDLLRFVVAMFGRLPIITPVWVYAVLMLACGAMVVPPFVAAVAATRPLARPSLMTAAWLALVAITVGFAYWSPAYTYAQPQRRLARVIVEPNAATATYEVASHEPGIDLAPEAPGNWYRVTDAPQASVPFTAYRHPYVFRATAPSPGPPPASLSEFTLKPVAAGTELTMTIVPSQPGLTAVFTLPPGVVPSRSNLPGIVGRGQWRAVYLGVPADGATLRASFKAGLEERVGAAKATVMSSRFPGGGGWQSLPPWLPQENAVWDMDVIWILR